MIKKVLHIIIAVFVVVSSTGFRINMHFCHDQLIDLALFSPAHSCCEKGTMASCHPDKEINQKNHCKDESIVVESTDDYVASSDTFVSENSSSIDLLLTASLLFNHQGVEDHIQPKAPWHKEPPPIREVVLSQIQTYLI